MTHARIGLLTAILITISSCTYVRHAPEGTTVADHETGIEVLRGILVFESKGGEERVGFWTGAINNKQFVAVSAQPLPKIENIELVAEEGRGRIERWTVALQGHRAVYRIRFGYVPGGGGNAAPFSLKPDSFTVSKFPP